MRHMSWSSRYEPSHQRKFSTASRFSPGLRNGVTSNSTAVRLSLPMPTWRPIDPEVEEGIDAVEGQQDPAAGPILGNREGAAIGIDRVVDVVIGNEGRSPGLAPRVTDVDIDGDAEAMYLDIRRHRERLPAAIVELGLPKIRHPRRAVGRVVVFPGAVERAVEWGFDTLGVDGWADLAGRLGVRTDHHRGVSRQIVAAGELGVFPIAQLGGEERRSGERGHKG